MDGPQRSLREAADASPQILGQHQSRDSGEEVGGSKELVSEEDQEEEVQAPRKDASKRGSSTGPEAAGRKVPPTQNRTLPHWVVHEMDEECGYGGMRVVPVQDTDTQPPVQRMQAMETATEEAVGRG